MAKKINFNLIIDFDSTFIKVEALEGLAKIVLVNNPKKEIMLAKIKSITNKGMKGEIGFYEELSSRLKLLNIKKVHINAWIKKIKNEISDSIIRNKKFIRQNKKQIYIISGAF